MLSTASRHLPYRVLPMYLSLVWRLLFCVYFMIKNATYNDQDFYVIDTVIKLLQLSLYSDYFSINIMERVFVLK